MTNLYYPEIDRGVGLVLKGALEITGARIASSVLQEFVFRKLTTNTSPLAQLEGPHRIPLGSAVAPARQGL